MDNLFQKKNFMSHSEKELSWKVDCDALTNDDYSCLAKMFSEKFSFSAVVGIPLGGTQFAWALKGYEKSDLKHPLLIVDDVLTTGASMEEKRKEVREHSIGLVIFSRIIPPPWIIPIWTLSL